MPDVKKILELIFQVVDELNERLPQEERLEKSKETPLTGEAAKLDSLKLVSLIVSTEQKVQEEFNTTITIVNLLVLVMAQSRRWLILFLLGLLLIELIHCAAT